jgi:hypothetical protein
MRLFSMVWAIVLSFDSIALADRQLNGERDGFSRAQGHAFADERLESGKRRGHLDRAGLNTLHGEDASLVGRGFVRHIGVGIQYGDSNARHHAALSVADGAGHGRTRFLCECAGREGGERAQR